MRAHTPADSDNQTRDNGFEPEVIYLSPEEWLVLFEQEVQDLMGVDAAEFIRRYRAGEYEDYDPDVMLLAVSITMFEAVTAGGS